MAHLLSPQIVNLRCDIDEMAVHKNEKTTYERGLINGFYRVFINLPFGESYPSANWRDGSSNYWM